MAIYSYMLSPHPLPFSGSTYHVTVTADFDEAFQELAMSRHQDQATITPDKPAKDQFKFDDIKQHLHDLVDPDQPLIQF